MKGTLSQDQGAICAYCEVRLDPDDPLRFRVEHIYSKSAGIVNGTNLALQWRNLLGVCTGGSQTALPRPHYLSPLPDNLSCDAHKQYLESKRRLPIPCTGRVLDPLQLPAFPSLWTFEHSTGRLLVNSAACNTAGVEVQLVESTLNALNLNCDRLCSARLVIARELERQKKAARAQGLSAREALPQLAQRALQGRWPAFFSTVRACLGTAADQWLQQRAFVG